MDTDKLRELLDAIDQAKAEATRIAFDYGVLARTLETIAEDGKAFFSVRKLRAMLPKLPSLDGKAEDDTPSPTVQQAVTTACGLAAGGDPAAKAECAGEGEKPEPGIDAAEELLPAYASTDPELTPPDFLNRRKKQA